MKKIDRDFWKSVVFFLLLGFSFFISSYIAGRYEEEIKLLVRNDIFGMAIYVVLNIIEVVFAPVNILPLIAVASKIWGVSVTVFLTVFAWTVGALIAFSLARRFGIGLVRRFVSERKLNNLQSKLPEEKVFFSIVLLRMFLPSDLLSYALGLFSSVKLRTFAFATFIGFIPLALIFSYLGVLPPIYQVIGFVVLGLVIILLYFYRERFFR